MGISNLGGVLIQKLEKLQTKAVGLTYDVPAGATASASMLSFPLWIENLTPWLEFGVLLCGFIVGIFTVIIYYKKLFNKK